MKKILLINAHQFYEGISSGRLNRTMAAVIQEEMERRGFAFQQTEIEKGYEIDAEVQKHLWADLIILQSPVYWFGTPWIYKKYVPSFSCHDVVKTPDVQGDIERLRKHLASFIACGSL